LPAASKHMLRLACKADALHRDRQYSERKYNTVLPHEQLVSSWSKWRSFFIYIFSLAGLALDSVSAKLGSSGPLMWARLALRPRLSVFVVLSLMMKHPFVAPKSQPGHSLLRCTSWSVLQNLAGSEKSSHTNSCRILKILKKSLKIEKIRSKCNWCVKGTEKFWKYEIQSN
jgi:hypothetical protein